MSKVSALRKEGNDLFVAEKYFAAYDSYNKAIQCCPSTDKSLLSQLKTNLSATALILEKPMEAINLATEALELDNTNYKAYIRRANAYAESLSWEDAVADYEAASRLQPSIKYFADRCEYAKRKQGETKKFADTPKPMELGHALEEFADKAPAQNNEEQTVPMITPRTEESIEHIKTIMREMLNDKRPSESEVLDMVRKCSAMHQKMQNIVKIDAKTIKIVGDTHGQFQDVVGIFEKFGYPSDSNPYLFNGDYVDRGSMSCEILITLMMWKLFDPNCIYINRGNHETSMMNSVYGFENECTAKYSHNLFAEFSKFFCCLPVGYIINGKVLVVHGGLVENQNATIDSLQREYRFSPDPSTGAIADLLWADPMASNGFMPSPRGVAAQFGPDVTNKFLANNGLEVLVRSHQVQEQGYGVMHNGKCITVFSAPNYTGVANNKGAILVFNFNQNGSIASQKYETFTAKPIPSKYRPLMYQSVSFR